MSRELTIGNISPATLQGANSMTFERERSAELNSAPEAAAYIASLTEELARLAKRHDLDSLAFILEMARLEADQLSKRWMASSRKSPAES
jgi:hypothetical protein